MPKLMALNVEISGRETIKPLTPTPAHLKFHNLTILDQTTPSAYVPVCLFYPSLGDTPLPNSTTLKASLSQTLNAYYPLAGRYKDAFSIECNDEGAEFVETNVAGDMLQHPDEDRLLALLPCPPRERHVDTEDKLILLAVQLNLFECGGVAIGVCMWHGVADACTLACFLRAWSTINNSPAPTGLSKAGLSVVVDCTSMFPPTRVNATVAVDSSSTATATTPVTKVKRFVFEGFQITTLRSGIERWWQEKRRPTRVEAVSALIWAAVITEIARDKIKKLSVSRADEQERCHDCYHVGMMVANLRSRMVPPLAEEVMGNLVHVPVFARWSMSNYEREEETGGGEDAMRARLAEKLRESVGKVKDENVRMMFGSSSIDCDKVFKRGVGYLDLFECFVEEYEKENLVVFSSWCRFPFYETDFGWGKPTLVGYFNMMDNLVVLIDSKDGEGIEAWVSLSDEDMGKFQNNRAILQYADFKC